MASVNKQIIFGLNFIYAEAIDIPRQCIGSSLCNLRHRQDQQESDCHLAYKGKEHLNKKKNVKKQVRYNNPQHLVTKNQPKKYDNHTFNTISL